MKLKVTGLVLAGLIVLSLTLSAFASGGVDGVADTAEENPVVSAEQPVQIEQSVSPVYLDGEPMEGLTYQVLNNVYYITVESFMAALDSEAVVEEEDGTVTVSAITVTEIMDVQAKEEAEVASGADWTGQANVEEETLSLTAKEGARYAVANGRYLYVEQGVTLVEGKVALPIRVLAKVFALDVAYDSGTRTAQLACREDGQTYLESANTYYDAETLYWLSHIIYSESGNQSLAGKLAVGNVVMNRVASPHFPDTIYEVLFQRNQFSPAASGSIYRDPCQESILAAKLVLDGAEVVGDALFFNRAGMNTYASRTRTYVTTIGAHTFYS